MASLVIKNLPKPLHDAIKAQAKAHRRSITQEAIVELEKAFQPAPRIRLPKPVKLLKPVSADDITRYIREGRDRKR